MKLKGQVALITGGSAGLGRAIVNRYIAEGARVAVLDKCASGLEELRNQHGDALVGIEGDVRLLASHQEAVARCTEAFGKLDCLVGNAGVWDFSTQLVDIPADRLDQAFDEMFAVNVKGNVLAAKAALPALYKSKGCAIFTTSSAAFYAGGGGVLYTASKQAVIGLVKQLAHEWGPHVRVNGIAPGGILGTDLRGPKALDLQDTSIKGVPVGDQLGPALPAGCVASADQYAGAYVFFATREDSVSMTGSVLNYDGGMGARGLFSANLGEQLDKHFI